MAGDWTAVAAAINTRLADLAMTQAELSTQSRVSTAMLREIQNPQKYPPRPRHPRTLEAISTALRWPPSHLAQVLEGDGTVDGKADLASELQAIRNELADLRLRVGNIEQQADRT